MVECLDKTWYAWDASGMFPDALERGNTMAQGQRKTIVVGQNVISFTEGSVIWFGVDTAVEGTQTEGSKGLDKKGHPKTPNEMVGSTRSYTGVGDGKLLLHYIRPMTVQAVRKARAEREIEAEDTQSLPPTTSNAVAEALATLKAAGVVE